MPPRSQIHFHPVRPPARCPILLCREKVNRPFLPLRALVASSDGGASRLTIFRRWESRFSAAAPSASRTAIPTLTRSFSTKLWRERYFLRKTFWVGRFNFAQTGRL